MFYNLRNEKHFLSFFFKTDYIQLRKNASVVTKSRLVTFPYEKWTGNEVCQTLNVTEEKKQNKFESLYVKGTVLFTYQQNTQ